LLPLSSIPRANNDQAGKKQKRGQVELAPGLADTFERGQSPGRCQMVEGQRFTAKFKREAVRLLDAGERPASELAIDLGIRRNQLY